jgi:hypothetical protein
LKKLRDSRCNKSGRDAMAAHIEHVKTDIVFTGILKIKLSLANDLWLDDSDGGEEQVTARRSRSFSRKEC